MQQSGKKVADIHRTQYRLPKPMADWLKARAESHFRSMNAELLEIIRAAMARESQDSVA